MAKKLEEVRKVTAIHTYKSPMPRCGCGRPAEYEVYEHHEPHCKSHMLEAVDCSTFIVVRRIGGFDDAS